VSAADIALIVLTLCGVLLLLTLVAVYKVNAFVALLISSLFVGFGAIVATDLTGNGMAATYSSRSVVRSILNGMGSTLGGIAVVLALGSMIGKLLVESGGAEVLAKRFVRLFGHERIQWCIVALAISVGLTTWFAVGLVLLLPILFTLTKETGRPFVLLALPLLSCLSVMHGLMPPHPGPVVAIENLKADTGLVLIWGFVVGIPTAMVAGPLYAKFISRYVKISVVGLPQSNESQGKQLPSFGLTVLTITLPIILMVFATGADLFAHKEGWFSRTAAVIGSPMMALLISYCFAIWSLGFKCKYTKGALLKFSEESVSGIGMTLLLVGAGGGFARVLRDCGAADAIGRLGAFFSLSPLMLGWCVSAFIRVSTGSATVAITTASALIAPVIALHPDLTSTHAALIIVAIGCGSLFLSHFNDSGFWIVKNCLGMTVGETLKVWTVCETIVGLTGLIFAWVCYQIV
jgi:GntP family gluconate:H+ symporter